MAQGRQTTPDVFAARLGRIDILSGGFARLVFVNVDDAIIEPPIVMTISAVSDAIRQAMLVPGQAMAGVIGQVLPQYKH